MIGPPGFGCVASTFVPWCEIVSCRLREVCCSRRFRRGTPAVLALAPSNPVPLFQALRRRGADAQLDLVEQLAQREKPIDGLGSLAGAPDDEVERRVSEHDGAGGLVDLLAARTATPDELLLDLREVDSETLDPLEQFGFLLGRDRGVGRELQGQGSPEGSGEFTLGRHPVFEVMTVLRPAFEKAEVRSFGDLLPRRGDVTARVCLQVVGLWWSYLDVVRARGCAAFARLGRGRVSRAAAGLSRPDSFAWGRCILARAGHGAVLPPLRVFSSGALPSNPQESPAAMTYGMSGAYVKKSTEPGGNFSVTYPAIGHLRHL